MKRPRLPEWKHMKSVKWLKPINLASFRHFIEQLKCAIKSPTVKNRWYFDSVKFLHPNAMGRTNFPFTIQTLILKSPNPSLQLMPN